MDDLEAFLRARLDEEERDAEELRYDWFGFEPGRQIAFVSEADAQHIVRHDPTRVIAEVKAKRTLIGDLLAWPHYAWEDRDEYGCEKRVAHEAWAQVNDREQQCTCGRDAQVDRTLRLLAQPHAHHPGYLEAWRP